MTINKTNIYKNWLSNQESVDLQFLTVFQEMRKKKQGKKKQDKVEYKSILQHCLREMDVIGWPSDLIAHEILKEAIAHFEIYQDELLLINENNSLQIQAAIRSNHKVWMRHLNELNHLFGLDESTLSMMQLCQELCHGCRIQLEPNTNPPLSLMAKQEILIQCYRNSELFIKSTTEEILETHPELQEIYLAVDPKQLVAQAFSFVYNENTNRELHQPNSYDEELSSYQPSEYLKSKLKRQIIHQSIIEPYSLIKPDSQRQRPSWLDSIKNKNLTLELMAAIPSLPVKLQGNCGVTTLESLEENKSLIRKAMKTFALDDQKSCIKIQNSVDKTFGFIGMISSSLPFKFLIDSAQDEESEFEFPEFKSELDSSLLIETINKSYGEQEGSDETLALNYLTQIYSVLYGNIRSSDWAMLQLLPLSGLSKDDLISHLSSILNIEKPNKKVLEKVIDVLSTKNDSYECLFSKITDEDYDEYYQILPWNLSEKLLFSSIINSWWDGFKPQKNQAITENSENNLEQLFKQVGFITSSGGRNDILPEEYKPNNPVIPNSQIDTIAFKEGHLLLIESKRKGVPYNLQGYENQKTDLLSKAWLQQLRLELRFKKKSKALALVLENIGVDYTDIKEVHFLVVTTDFSYDGELIGGSTKRSYLEVMMLSQDWKSRKSDGLRFDRNSSTSDFIHELKYGKLWEFNISPDILKPTINLMEAMRGYCNGGDKLD